MSVLGAIFVAVTLLAAVSIAADLTIGERRRRRALRGYFGHR